MRNFKFSRFPPLKLKNGKRSHGLNQNLYGTFHLQTRAYIGERLILERGLEYRGNTVFIKAFYKSLWYDR